VVAGVETRDGEMPLRQECLLNAGRQVQVTFEGVTFFAGEIVEAELDQGIGQQAVVFDGIMASIAEAVSAFVHAREGGIDFLEQRGEGTRCRWGRECGLETGASAFELRAQIRLLGDGDTAGHGSLRERLG
jgi:hypothetical protein